MKIHLIKKVITMKIHLIKKEFLTQMPHLSLRWIELYLVVNRLFHQI
jgi:hypothetical protein